MTKIKILSLVLFSSLASSSFANVNDYIMNVSKQSKIQKKSVSQDKLEALKLSVFKSAISLILKL